MDDLRLVGLSPDGARLVVEGSGGQSYGLPVDERLHAALRGDRARLGQLQINIESELRPREIQARIRAGQTAEEIAAAAGVPLDRVRRYETPILLERTHVAQLAQAVGIRRVTDAVTTPLGVLVRTRLDGHGVAEDSVDWDSWRRDDGRWMVRLTYAAKGDERAATWLFDLERRTVEPADDEARWLTDEERAAPERRRSTAPRLTAVPAPEPEPEVGRHDTVPVVVADEPVAEPADVDPAPVAEPATAASSPRKPRTARRAAVPSWDEILFGAPRRDDDKH